MNRQLYAYTATHGRPYPEYLNVSVTPDGRLVAIMRGPPSPEGHEGATVSVELPESFPVELLQAQLMDNRALLKAKS